MTEPALEVRCVDIHIGLGGHWDLDMAWPGHAGILLAGVDHIGRMWVAVRTEELEELGIRLADMENVTAAAQERGSTGCSRVGRR